MVTNLMFMKFNDKSPENLALAKNTILSMKGNIEPLIDVRVKEDLHHGGQSYDFAVFTEFASEADFQAYIVHPLHAEVGKKITDMCESIVMVFYED